MMPTLLLVGIPGPRWLPLVPIPVFLLWPLIPFGLGLARLMDRDRPTEAAKLRATMLVFCELRGLCIDVDGPERKPLRIRFL